MLFLIGTGFAMLIRAIDVPTRINSFLIRNIKPTMLTLHYFCNRAVVPFFTRDTQKAAIKGSGQHHDQIDHGQNNDETHKIYSDKHTSAVIRM